MSSEAAGSIDNESLSVEEYRKRTEEYRKQSEEFKKSKEELERVLDMNRQLCSYLLRTGLNSANPLHGVKRKSLAVRESKRRSWSDANCTAAIEAERKYYDGIKLIIHFPDPEIDENFILQCNDDIESISFITGKSPRYCSITVDSGANIADLIEKINRTAFGNGYLKAEVAVVQNSTDNLRDYRRINPLVLYVGNIPINPKVNSHVIKQLFKRVKKIDISTHKKMPHKFLHAQYHTTEDAISDFNHLINVTVCNQSLDVRFFRMKDTVDLPSSDCLDQDAGVTSSNSCYYHDDDSLSQSAYGISESLKSIDTRADSSKSGCSNTGSWKSVNMTADSSKSTGSKSVCTAADSSCSFIQYPSTVNLSDSADDDDDDDDNNTRGTNTTVGEADPESDDDVIDSDDDDVVVVLDTKVKTEPKLVQIDNEDDDSDCNDDDDDDNGRKNNLMFIPYTEEDAESDFSD